MFTKKKVIYLVWIMLLLVGATGVAAFTGYEPSGEWNVTPQKVSMEVARDCPEGSYLIKDEFQSGNPPLTRTFKIGPDEVEVTVAITIDGNTIDFTIINGFASRVAFKGGGDSDTFLYQYDPIPLGGTNTNTGPVSYDTKLHDNVNKDGDYLALSHLDFCLIPKEYKPLTAEKTAAGTYDRTVKWTLDKSVDVKSHTGYAGQDAGTSNWKVEVKKTEVSDNYQVTGEITINNPNTYPVDVTVSDQLGDGTVAVVDCDPITEGDQAFGTIPAIGSITCSYTALPTGKTATLNTATITAMVDGKDLGTTATAEVLFTEKLIGYDSGTLSDDNDYNPNEPTLISGDTTWKYGQTFTCSSDPADYGTNGMYSFNVPNTATLNDNIKLSDTEKVDVTCYLQPLEPTKDAAGSYDRTVTWKLEKTVDPASHIGFAGMTAGSSTWTVKATKTEVSDNYKVVGTISVYNPAAIPQTFTVEDYLDDAAETTAVVNCDMYTILPLGTAKCEYTATPSDGTATVNTAKVSAPGNVDQFAYKEFKFVENLKGYDKGTLGDKRFDYSELISGSTTKTFKESFDCPKDPSLYEEGGGVYSFKEVNEATLNDNIDLKDSAEVNVTCYAPVVTKTADASYKETWTWTLEKSVDETFNSGYPGDKLDWVWKVIVGETFENSDFMVTGKIYIKNPAPMPMTVALSDKLDDGTVASIEYCETPSKEDDFSGTVTVDAESTAVCYYTAEPGGKTAVKNTATAVLNSIEFTGEATVKFEKTVINGKATVTDTMIGLNESLIAGDGGTREWTKPYDHTCSTLKSAYGVDGTYGETINNTAYLTSDLQKLESKATTEYTCEAGFVDLLKLTDGSEEYMIEWAFNLYTSGYDGVLVASSKTPPAYLDFGGPALRPDTTYTVCELAVPVGYTSVWYLDGSQIYPYNPDAPLENLGNICYDFKPSIGTTISFTVDNTSAYGDPRTPGYWKNWNTCTGGGQQFTAAANGGWKEGFWLLDDVLGLTDYPDGGISWIDVLVEFYSTPEKPVNPCELAVSILNTRDFLSGKQMAGDAGYNLAKHLLATQANFIAGACIPPTSIVDIKDIALQAETLLDKIDFDAVGVGIDKKDKKTAAEALRLAGILDQYNNGVYCGSTVP